MRDKLERLQQNERLEVTCPEAEQSKTQSALYDMAAELHISIIVEASIMKQCLFVQRVG